MINTYNVEQGSQAWFDLRLGRITGSKFNDLMSGRSTAGYQNLINRAVGEILCGESEMTYQNDTMRRGTEMEPFARKMYEDTFQREVIQVGFVTNPGIFPEYCGVSPDGMPENGLIEIKCPLITTHVAYLKANKLPTVYRRQVQGQLMITEAEWCDFVSYYPSMRQLVVRVEPDLVLHAQMKERLAETIELIKESVKQLK